MEDAFQESEAARLEAVEAEQRKKARDRELTQAEAEAKSASARAEKKKKSALDHIGKMESEMEKLKVQIAEAEKRKAKAEQVYEEYSLKQEQKRQELEQVRGELRQKQDLLSEQNRQNNSVKQGIETLNQEIRAEKQKILDAEAAYKSAQAEEVRLNEQLKIATSNAEKQRLITDKRVQAAQAKIEKSKANAQAARDKMGALRAPTSAFPGPARKAKLKRNCSGFANPDPGASTSWTGTSGQVIEGTLYNKSWIQIQTDDGGAAFLPRSCF